MALGALLGGLFSAALPYVPKVFQFVKAGLSKGVPMLIKGAQKARELAERAGVFIGALKTGAETLKTLPYIGEKIRGITEREDVKRAVEGAENIVRKIGTGASTFERELPGFASKFQNPLEVR